MGIGLGINLRLRHRQVPTLPPLSRFQYDINFVAGTAAGGTQVYGNNNNDGRFFRDPSNITATWVPDATGLLIAQASAGLRRTSKGQFSYMSGTNSILWNRDLTNVVWTKTSVTAAKTTTGADGVANAATRLTATANGGTVKQTFTIASNTFVFSVDMKRITGSGQITLSLDGGTTNTIVTPGATYTQVFCTQSAVTNPTVTITMATSGDVIDVDFCQMCVPSIAGLNIPTQQRYATTSATVINSQSRANAATADLGPLAALAQGYFGFYWQGRTERPGTGYVITSDSGVFCNFTATGALVFSCGTGTSTTAAGVQLTGLGNLNKVAGYFTSGGMKVACNGQLGNASTGTLSPALTHFDLGTNGSGANSLMGINERVMFGTGLSFTDAELVSMTT